MMEVLGPEQEVNILFLNFYYNQYYNSKKKLLFIFPFFKVLLDFSSFTKFFEKLVNFLSHHYACVGMQESAKQLVVLFIYIFYFNNTNN
jgi:hypothetical protein